jgi:rubrerythrin
VDRDVAREASDMINAALRAPARRAPRRRAAEPLDDAPPCEACRELALMFDRPDHCPACGRCLRAFS